MLCLFWQCVQTALPGIPDAHEVMEVIQDLFFVAAPCGGYEQSLWPVPCKPVNHNAGGEVFQAGDDHVQVFLFGKGTESTVYIEGSQIRAAQYVEKLDLDPKRGSGIQVRYGLQHLRRCLPWKAQDYMDDDREL